MEGVNLYEVYSWTIVTCPPKADITQALSLVLHARLYKFPSYSPHLNIIEHLWKRLRQHVTRNRLFVDAAEWTPVCM